MNRHADRIDRKPGLEDEGSRTVAFSEALLELERSKLAPVRTPRGTPASVLRQAANAAVRYINELAIADRDDAIGPELDWLIELAATHPDDAELAVAAATAMFDHICNLGVGQRFGEAESELQRMRTFVSRYPHEPSVQVRFSSASENLESMIGWVEEDASSSEVP